MQYIFAFRNSPRDHLRITYFKDTFSIFPLNFSLIMRPLHCKGLILCLTGGLAKFYQINVNKYEQKYIKKRVHVFNYECF